MKRRQSYLSSLDMFIDTVIPRVSEGKGDIASNSSLKKTFYSDFYYAIQQHSSTLVPAFFSLTTFPSLLHLCGAILSSCSFNIVFRRLPSLTPLPWGLLSGFQDYTVIARFFTKNLIFFLQHSFATLGYFWQGWWIQCSCCMTLWYCFRCSQHHLTIYPILDRKVSMKIVGSISLSLSPLFLSNCIKQLVPYVFTTFSCDQLLAIFLSLVPHSACSTPFCRLILDSTSRSILSQQLLCSSSPTPLKSWERSTPKKSQQHIQSTTHIWTQTWVLPLICPMLSDFCPGLCTHFSDTFPFVQAVDWNHAFHASSTL